LAEPFQLLDNIRAGLEYGDRRMLLALWNSTLLTVGSVTLIIFLSALVAYVMQRRRDKVLWLASSVMLAGLIIPPAVVPTIFMLQWLGLYKTLFGLILVEVAFGMPFAVLVFRAFISSIPAELDEAAIVDGASPLRVFFSVIMPLLRPAMVTIIVVQAVTIYNDFASPLYFLPGQQNVTAQLTLYSFLSQFNSQWNLLFADVNRHYDPAPHHVLVLPTPDRRRADRRGSQRLEFYQGIPAIHLTEGSINDPGNNMASFYARYI
jgi:raffinose/stachyose/melibiose transport system permease protein